MGLPIPAVDVVRSFLGNPPGLALLRECYGNNNNNNVCISQVLIGLRRTTSTVCNDGVVEMRETKIVGKTECAGFVNNKNNVHVSICKKHIPGKTKFVHV